MSTPMFRLEIGGGPVFAKPGQAAPAVTVLGTPEHEGRLCGRAFELLGTSPTFALDGLPHSLDFNSPPDVILVSREWSRAARLTVARARRRGVPVVYLMDGIIEWSYVWNNLSYIRPEGTVLQPMLASHLCVIGRHPARILAGLGLGDRLHVVGMPRLDEVDRRRVVDPAAPPTVVITTARTAAHDVEQKTLVRRALRDLKRWFEEHAFARVVWRIAPELAAELGVPVNNDTPLVDALREATALVSFASTTLLEGMLMGVPTALVDYRSVPQYVDTAWEIRSAEHLDAVMHDLLHPRPERLALQDWCLREELETGDASARLADVLRAAARGEPVPDRQASPGSSASQYGRLDYRQVHSELSAFSVSPMSLLQYELDAASNLLDYAMPDIVQLRGEVTRLQSEVTQLQGDLDTQRAELERSHVAYGVQKDLRQTAERRARELEGLDGFQQRVYIDRLRPFVATLERTRIRHITIYGAEHVGRALLALCRDAGIRVRRLVDRDSALWGQTIDGVEVTALHECRNDRSPVIAIASFSHAAEMRRTVREQLRGKSGLRLFAPRPWRL